MIMWEDRGGSWLFKAKRSSQLLVALCTVSPARTQVIYYAVYRMLLLTYVDLLVSRFCYFWLFQYVYKKPSCCWDRRLMAPYQYYRLSQSWPWNDPLKLNRGQRSRCTFIHWATVNIFVYRYPGRRSSRWEDMRHFHFHDLVKPLKGQPRSKVKVYFY